MGTLAEIKELESRIILLEYLVQKIFKNSSIIEPEPAFQCTNCNAGFVDYNEDNPKIPCNFCEGKGYHGNLDYPK